MLPADEADHYRTKSGKDTFDHDDLKRIFGGKCSCAVVPKEFALNHLVGSLAEAVKWWIGGKMEMPPEELADFYLKLISYGN